MRRSVLPLMAVLVAAPFFADYRGNPLQFGLLQGVLIAAISISGAGGFAPFRARMRNKGFVTFWVLLLGLGIAAPFLMQILKT